MGSRVPTTARNQLQQRLQHAMSSADDEDYDSQEGSRDDQNSNGDHDAEASGLRLSGKKRRRLRSRKWRRRATYRRR